MNTKVSAGDVLAVVGGNGSGKSTLLLSQRYLAALLLFLGLVAVLTSSGAGPLTAAHASVAGAVLPCSVWPTMALIGLEDRPHRSIVVVSTGSHLRVPLATVGTAAVWCLLLTAAGLVLTRTSPRSTPPVTSGLPQQQSRHGAGRRFGPRVICRSSGRGRGHAVPSLSPGRSAPVVRRGGAHVSLPAPGAMLPRPSHPLPVRGPSELARTTSGHGVLPSLSRVTCSGRRL
ncbi:hypothetical protein ACFUN7_33980 [Streptomyces sp. NPDC057236]|uniref:hypothetical protein n=1 Tax=Streptomyces sp. NPDC057236 TaxID=3346059 RepID=UPI003630E712